MNVFYFAFIVWALGPHAGLGGSLEDVEPGAVNGEDHEGTAETLEHTASASEYGLAWNEFDGSERQQRYPQGEADRPPPLQGQGCSVVSSASPQAVEHDNPVTSRLWDSVVPEFSGSLEAGNGSVPDENSVPSTLDTITSRESINLILPSEDVLNILAMKSLDVNLSGAAQPDFRSLSTSSHHVSSTSKPPVSTNDTNPAKQCHVQPSGSSPETSAPIQRASPSFSPVPPPLQSPFSPWQCPARSLPTRTTTPARQGLQPTGPTPRSLQHRKQHKRKVISPACQDGRRTYIKQRKRVIQPMPRSCGSFRSAKKPVRKGGETDRRCKIPASCTSTRTIKQKKQDKPRQVRTTCSRKVNSNARKLPVRKPKRKSRKNRVVVDVYMT